MDLDARDIRAIADESRKRLETNGVPGPEYITRCANYYISLITERVKASASGGGRWALYPLRRTGSASLCQASYVPDGWSGGDFDFQKWTKRGFVRRSQPVVPTDVFYSDPRNLLPVPRAIYEEIRSHFVKAGFSVELRFACISNDDPADPCICVTWD